jgi:hypothetical protein
MFSKELANIFQMMADKNVPYNAIEEYENDCEKYPLEKAEYDFGFFTGFIQRHKLGHNCGYLRLPVSHLFYKKAHDDIPVRVHGGLTFSQLDENDNWVIGFDTAHDGDLVPLLPSSEEDDHYWTHQEVFEELMKLYKQLCNF